MQSLGNMVACEAVDVSLRAEALGDAPFGKYVRPDWRDYTNACWAANWHRFFEGDPNDARGRMKWPERFSTALGNAGDVFNYYSSGDAVFTEVDGVPDLLDDVVHWDGGFDWLWHVVPYPDLVLAFENHSWQKQEVLKGMATLAGTLSGGWGFNVWQEYDLLTQTWKGVRYSPEGAAAAVANGSITNRPAFDVSGALELMSPNATEDDVFLALAKHVPALSSPVGGSAITFGNKIENHDLNSSDYRNGWGRNHPNFEDSWLHSDMKDMAYYYVYKLYEQLVTKGNLK